MKIDYDKIAAEYSRHREVHPKVLTQLLSAVPSGPSNVLEIGCGTGNYITEIASVSDCFCFGVDPSIEMLKKASSKTGQVTFKKGTAEKLPFDDGIFDFVFSVDVVHHVDSCLDYFLQAYRVLRKGGLFCTVTDSEWIIKNRTISKYFPETIPLEMGRYHAAATLRINLKTAGFLKPVEDTVEMKYKITDLAPYKDKSYSALHLLPGDLHKKGLLKMEEDLKYGPIPTVSRFLMLWGEKL
jgi:ubiquinone/menaquinone biosynthesis C-methylase UbiE